MLVQHFIPDHRSCPDHFQAQPKATLDAMHRTSAPTVEPTIEKGTIKMDDSIVSHGEVCKKGNNPTPDIVQIPCALAPVSLYPLTAPTVEPTKEKGMIENRKVSKKREVSATKKLPSPSCPLSSVINSLQRKKKSCPTQHQSRGKENCLKGATALAFERLLRKVSDKPDINFTNNVFVKNE